MQGISNPSFHLIACIIAIETTLFFGTVMYAVVFTCHLVRRLYLGNNLNTDRQCRQTLVVSAGPLLSESISVPQPSRFYPCPSRYGSFRANCEEPMPGNSVWHLYWQIYGFISVNKYVTSGYVVGISFPQELKLNFWEFWIGQPMKSKTLLLSDQSL